MIIRVVAILFLLIFASFEAKKFISKSKNDLSVENIKKEINLESGDIILKREDNELSNYLATFDSSGYSHIGLIIDTKYGLKVVHIDIDEKNDELQISDLNDFINFSTKIAVLIPTVFAIIQLTDISSILYLFIFLVLIQFVIGNVIYPKLM